MVLAIEFDEGHWFTCCPERRFHRLALFNWHHRIVLAVDQEDRDLHAGDVAMGEIGTSAGSSMLFEPIRRFS